MQNEYHYRFEGSGHVRCRGDEVWNPTAIMSLDSVRTTTWLGPFSAQERDLLRVMAAVLGGIALVELLLISRVNVALGARAGSGPLDGAGTNVEQLSEALFTKFLFPFEITSVLLVIAVVGAVLLSRKPKAPDGAGSTGSVGGGA